MGQPRRTGLGRQPRDRRSPRFWASRRFAQTIPNAPLAPSSAPNLSERAAPNIRRYLANRFFACNHRRENRGHQNRLRASAKRQTVALQCSIHSSERGKNRIARAFEGGSDGESESPKIARNFPAKRSGYTKAQSQDARCEHQSQNDEREHQGQNDEREHQGQNLVYIRANQRERKENHGKNWGCSNQENWASRREDIKNDRTP